MTPTELSAAELQEKKPTPQAKFKEDLLYDQVKYNWSNEAMLSVLKEVTSYPAYTAKDGKQIKAFTGINDIATIARINDRAAEAARKKLADKAKEADAVHDAAAGNK